MPQPRSPQSLDHSRLWDKSVVESRINDLTIVITSELALEDSRKRADELKRDFKPVTPYPYSSGQIRDRFSQKARETALELLEIERKNFVDYKAERIKTVLNTVLKQLRYLVYTRDEKGKVTKIEVFIENIPKPDNRGNWVNTDIQYVGDRENRDVERLEQINRVRDRLSHFTDYAPYFNEELTDLWQKANEMASLEVIRVDKNTPSQPSVTESLETLEPIDIGAD